MILLLLYADDFSAFGESKEEYGQVEYAPDVNAAMYEADYWIEKVKDPQKILMEPTEIENLNAQIFSADQGLVYDLWHTEETIDGEILTKTWAESPIPEYPLYRQGVLMTAADWEAYRENIKNPEAESWHQIVYAICIKRAAVKQWPETAIVSADAQESYIDEFQLTSIRWNSPVVIDGQTADGVFYHVKSYDYEGFALASCFARCKNREEWIQAQASKDDLVVTVPRLRLEITGELLTMGCRIRRASCGINDIWGCYSIEVPYRDEDGAYAIRYGRIPIGAGVHVGYLPYTTENVLKLSFLFLGQCYGWGGMFDSVDCSALVQDVYTCFGMMLPRDAGAQMDIPVEKLLFKRNMTSEKRTAMLAGIRPGSLLYFEGHIMIYIGKEERNFYVVSAVGSLGLEKDQEGTIRNIRSVIINTLSVLRKNGHSWEEEILCSIF